MLPRGEASVSSTAAAPPGHGRLLQSVSSTAHQGKAADAMPCHAMPCPTRGGAQPYRRTTAPAHTEN